MSGYHAIETAKGWSVRKGGSARAIHAGQSEQIAWSEAQRLAKKHGAIAYKHDNTGRISERIDP